MLNEQWTNIDDSRDEWTNKWSSGKEQEKGFYGGV